MDTFDDARFLQTIHFFLQLWCHNVGDSSWAEEFGLSIGLEACLCGQFSWWLLLTENSLVFLQHECQGRVLVHSKYVGYKAWQPA